MNDFAQAGFDPASSPQVRTLLLTDLCDSTLLVERLGDAPAAELFRAHDRIVLELQQRWRGRLIDRSDGLLLLFERPVDGLGFALDYTRGLRELGDRPELRDRKLTLQARAGLHVGEVLTWLNSEAAVQAGAKPLEVEGLAKPLAGRLMTLARPGQILLSATAEPLARRAARELGERSEHLIWKSHGRWRFKGVPDGQEIFEVGEPGYAPLRAPKQNGGKAWRDIPVWRRPAALAAEVFLVAGIATGAWFLTRPTPAIAFNERDWVVVGDLRNLTGQPVLDESLEQAFRISLEQSRYVNVLSDLKVRDTLSLMKRGPTTALDRAIASEIAIRDGARAVILPTVAEVGGRVRVSAEVIDPHTQTTVYAESADGVGAGSTLGSIDKVTGELREKLGEAIASIERDSEPLPQVSTTNLDALKAYALGQHKRFSRDLKEALAYFKRATELDPNFALAYLARSRVETALADFPARHQDLMKAAALRDHLTPREQLQLDAELSRIGGILPQLERWKQLVEMYPDSYNERLILAQDGMFYANRYDQAVSESKASTLQQFDGRATAYYLLGISQVATEHPKDAIASFEAARRAGLTFEGISHAFAYAATRDYAGANRVLEARKPTGVATADLEADYGRMLIAIDRGRFNDASRLASTSRTAAIAREPLIAGSEWRSRALAVDILAGKLDKASAEPLLLTEIAQARANARNTDVLYVGFSESIALGVGYMGARLDSLRVVEAALNAVSESKDVNAYPQLGQLRDVLIAERDRLQGHGEVAIQRLVPLTRRDDGLIFAHSALVRAARAGGNDALALEQAKWLATHRGRAFVEGKESALPMAFNIADTTLSKLDEAEAQARAGNRRESIKAVQAVTAVWPDAQVPIAVRRRMAALGG